jgi:diguanylate cyclase (GGDEF)-like protein/PAS domain S-box-containing protein
MLLYFYLANFGILGLFLILKLFSKTRKKDYTYLTFVVGLFGLAYFYFISSFEDVYFTYFVYGFLTMVYGVFTIKLLMRILSKDATLEDIHDLEDELESLGSVSELLRKRFVSTLELLYDGVAFKEEDEKYFGTDKFIQLLGLNYNEFSEQELLEIIHKDDVLEYQKNIKNLSKRSPIYKTTYRVKKNGGFLWIKEVGKLIVHDKKNTYISLIKPMDVKQFPESEVDVLNSLPNSQNLRVEMQRLKSHKIPYYFVLIQLTNIPQINEKYGRDIGDLFMGEYLKKLRYNFIKDEESLYRVDGVKFAMILKNEKKYEVLKRALTGTGELMNFTMQFGGVEQAVYPNLGVTSSPYEAKDVEQVLKEANKALKETLVPNTKNNYAFYE